MLDLAKQFLFDHWDLLLMVVVLLSIVYDRILTKQLREAFNATDKVQKAAIAERDETIEKMTTEFKKLSDICNDWQGLDAKKTKLLAEKAGTITNLTNENDGLKKTIGNISNEYVSNDQYDTLAARYTVSLNTVELLGRLGYIHGDVWKKNNTNAYVNCFIHYFDDNMAKFVDKIKKHPKMDEGTVKEIQNRLERIKDHILDKTTCIFEVVETLHVALNNYYRELDIYFETGGPVPLMIVDKEYVNGEMFKDLVKDLVLKEKFTPAHAEGLVATIVNLLIYPLSVCIDAVNCGEASPYINNTGIFYQEIAADSIGLKAHFVVPLSSMKVLQSVSAVNFLKDK